MVLTALGQGKAASALYPDFVGRRAIFVGSGAGPAVSSSAVVSADTITLALPNYYIDAVLDGASTDGLYYIQAFPAGSVGPRATWKCFYYSMSTGAIQNANNLSGSTFVMSALVGAF